MLIENQRILPLKPTILWLLKQRFPSFQPIRTPSKLSHTFDCTPGNRCILSIHPVFQNIKKGSLKRKAYYLPRLFIMPPSALMITSRNTKRRINQHTSSFVLHLYSLPLHTKSINYLKNSNPSRMKVLFHSLFILLFVFTACTSTPKQATIDYTQYVNPFIGTDFTGNTYPGAQVPFGMVQLSPDNGLPGWDRISGYFYPDSTIAGFSHTHLSGSRRLI